MKPMLGQIVLFGGNFAPEGWSFCDGQLLKIADHTSLYAILGATYGGDGRTSFALPDLRGRVPMHAGAAKGLTRRRIGQQMGAETVTLDQTDLGAATGPGTQDVTHRTGTAINNHVLDNMQPTLCLNYIIATSGYFPTRG